MMCCHTKNLTGIPYKVVSYNHVFNTLLTHLLAAACSSHVSPAVDRGMHEAKALRAIKVRNTAA